MQENQKTDTFIESGVGFLDGAFRPAVAGVSGYALGFVTDIIATFHNLPDVNGAENLAFWGTVLMASGQGINNLVDINSSNPNQRNYSRSATLTSAAIVSTALILKL